MKPLVSYLLFAYNQEAFVEEALRSAFAQAYEPMEIIVTDDFSADSTAQVIERVIADSGGAKDVRFRRHPQNLGLGNAVNSAVAEARGEILVMAAGDDVSHPERTAALVDEFIRNSSVQAVYSNAEIIDESGAARGMRYNYRPPMSIGSRREKLLKFKSPSTAILGAVSSYRKEAFSKFAPLSPDTVYEDKVLPLRALLLGTTRYIDMPLVRYRQHGGNVWHGVKARAVDPLARHRYEIRMRRHLITVLESRLGDISAGAALASDFEEELEIVRRATRAVLERYRAETAIFDDRNILKRAIHARQYIASGDLQPGLRAKWAFLKQNFFPSAYYRQLMKIEAAKAR